MQKGRVPSTLEDVRRYRWSIAKIITAIVLLLEENTGSNA